MTEISIEEMERRQTFRIDMEKEFVDITWQDKIGLQHQKKTVCLNFSQSGLKLECDQEIPEQTIVKVIFKAAETKSRVLIGKALRCTKKEHGWFEIALLLEQN